MGDMNTWCGVVATQGEKQANQQGNERIDQQGKE
jgi:hypothetical protein